MCHNLDWMVNAGFAVFLGGVGFLAIAAGIYTLRSLPHAQ